MREVQGIILRVQDYKDNDKLIHVLVKDEGIITLYGRALNKINSKNASNCLPYMVSNFVIEEHDLKKILRMRSCSAVKMFKGCRDDLVKQTMAMCICEYVYAASNDAVNDVYELMIETLELLERSEHPSLVYCIFLKKISEVIGIVPHVDGCVVCGSKTHICAFSIKEGGFICSNCNANEEHLNKDILYLLRVICKAEYENINQIAYQKEQIIEIINILTTFIKIYGSLTCKGINFLLEVLHL